MLDRDHFCALDAHDPLAHLRSRFRLPSGVYLDGNSLGPMPSHVAGVVERVAGEEWGGGLVASWNERGWWELPLRVGDRIAPLIGAGSGTVVAGDTTTVSLYKAAAAACRLRPDRNVILTDTGNFPSDLYVLESVARRAGRTVVAVAPEAVEGRLSEDVAVLALTHVDYRTGRRHSMPHLTEMARQAGALSLWDLSHSVGAMDVDVSQADLAVGCGYKYLNGGPGAPAFLYVNGRHHDDFGNPIAGWWAHEEPFAMEADFRPAAGIRRALTGTQPIISLSALDAALDVFDGIDLPALRAKSERLTEDFLFLTGERLNGFEVVTPRDPHRRGSHVTLAHPEAARIMAALVARGVRGDVRPPGLLRFGLAPVFQRHVDVWDAVEALRRVMEAGEWRRVPERAGPVT